MPTVVRGSARRSLPDLQTDSQFSPPTSPADGRRVTFDQRRDEAAPSSPLSTRFFPRISTSSRRRSAQYYRDRDRSVDLENDADAYYDSRAATHREFRRRASTLQSYYLEHPELLPQLPFTFRHGFKRWKLAGYIALMVFDACVVPIMLYYAMTFGGDVQGYIVFAVVTAIWGGPTYVEFAVRSLRLIKRENFYKPLGANHRWVFDITNWILILTITAVTCLLIVGAAPHIVFLRVLSMPGPAILYSLAGPIFLLTLYSACGWKAPFRISSTPKGDEVLPGIYYIVEDIVSVNAGGGRPFREGWAARYNASPIFRKMIRDQSWFWSIPGLFVAIACTIIICIHPVPKPVAYGIGWGVPFVWAGIWASITVPWVRSVMREEKRSWEEDTAMIAELKNRHTPSAVAPVPTIKKPIEPSPIGPALPPTEEEPNTPENATNPSHAENSSQHSDGATL